MLKKTAQQALELGKTKTGLGHVATYIPELGKADPSKLGMCIYTAEGEKICVGDYDTRFSIQSVSKIISLAIALEVYSKEVIFENVGMEPTGDAFNSLMKLERADGTPYNPLINAGALVISSYLVQMYTFEELLATARELCMDPGIVLDIKVCHSEMSNLSRNRAIAYLLESKGRAIDLNNSALGNTANTQRCVQCQRAGGDRFHIHLWAVTQTHNRTLAKIFLDLRNCCLQCLFLIRSRGRCLVYCLFRSHIKLPSCRSGQ